MQRNNLQFYRLSSNLLYDIIIGNIIDKKIFNMT